jgi:hypothetical protein
MVTPVEPEVVLPDLSALRQALSTVLQEALSRVSDTLPVRFRERSSESLRPTAVTVPNMNPGRSCPTRPLEPSP